MNLNQYFWLCRWDTYIFFLYVTSLKWRIKRTISQENRSIYIYGSLLYNIGKIFWSSPHGNKSCILLNIYYTANMINFVGSIIIEKNYKDKKQFFFFISKQTNTFANLWHSQNKNHNTKISISHFFKYLIFKHR